MAFPSEPKVTCGEHNEDTKAFSLNSPPEGVKEEEAERPAAASEVSQPKRPTTLAEILAEVKALAPMVDKGDMEYAQKEALLGAIRT